MDEITVGVVGVGGMGSNHVRVLTGLPDVRGIMVFDLEPVNTQRVRAFSSKVRVAASLAELLGSVDAVVIATPSPTHFAVTSAALQAGLHILVEKPLALTVQDAETLARLAAQHGRVFQVGHVERYNPVVRALEKVLSAREIIAVEADRLSLVSNRSSDLVTDLMLHDIDIVSMLAGEAEPEVVSAMGAWRDDVLVHVHALMNFGAWIANLTVSQVAQEKTRQLKVFTTDIVATVDYVQKTMRVQKLEDMRRLNDVDSVGFLSSSSSDSYSMEGEPLRAELASFVDSVLTGTPPSADGWVGARAVRLSARVLDASRRSQREGVGV